MNSPSSQQEVADAFIFPFYLRLHIHVHISNNESIAPNESIPPQVDPLHGEVTKREETSFTSKRFLC